MQTQPIHAAFGPCHIEFTRTVDFEPPTYLFQEFLERVEETPNGTVAIETTDAVISAVDLTRSSWTVVPLKSLDDEVDAAGATNSAGGSSSNDFEFSRLILQGAFTPIQLSAAALDPLSGFTSSNVVRAVQALGQKLASGAHLRNRSLIGRALTPAELTSENLAMQRVMMSNHFINVLAWQRLQELLVPSDMIVESEGTQTSAVVETPAPPRRDLGSLKPSVSPWASEYDDGSIACPEEVGNLFLDQLAEHFTGLSSKRFASSAQQTDDSLRQLCAGVIPITSPYADITKTAPPLLQDPLTNIRDNLRSHLASLRHLQQGSSAWEIVIQSNGAAVDTLYIPDAAGEHVSLGRDEVGFSSSSRAFISASLGTFTEHPKLVSPLHLILSTTSKRSAVDAAQSKTSLNITACGRNGIRVLGRRHLLAGQSFMYPAPSQDTSQSLRLHVTPDLSISVSFKATATTSISS